MERPQGPASVDPPAQANGATAERPTDDSALGPAAFTHRGTVRDVGSPDALSIQPEYITDISACLSARMTTPVAGQHQPLISVPNSGTIGAVSGKSRAGSSGGASASGCCDADQSAIKPDTVKRTVTAKSTHRSKQ